MTRKTLKNTQTEMQRHKSLSQYANEILSDWPNPPEHVRERLIALQSVDQITGYYDLDTVKSIVLYVLAGMGGWRGETAKKIKKELNDICKKYHTDWSLSPNRKN